MGVRSALQEFIGPKIFRHKVTFDAGVVFQKPSGIEGLPTWKKIADPPTGWLASKTTGWTADSFSGGLEVDFSAVVPAGTKAVRIDINNITAVGAVYYRKSGDANISNTPNASSEFSHCIGYDGTATNWHLQVVVWLSSDYKVQFAVSGVNQDLNISYPVEYLS